MREAYLFGPFRLLAHQRELFAHGVPIPVGQRAFDILLVLVSRHGHLVTKDEHGRGVARRHRRGK